MDKQIFSALVQDASTTSRAQVAKTLQAFGVPALRFAADMAPGSGLLYAESATPRLRRS